MKKTSVLQSHIVPPIILASCLRNISVTVGITWNCVDSSLVQWKPINTTGKRVWKSTLQWWSISNFNAHKNSTFLKLKFFIYKMPAKAFVQWIKYSYTIFNTASWTNSISVFCILQLSWWQSPPLCLTIFVFSCIHGLDQVGIWKT